MSAEQSKVSLETRGKLKRKEARGGGSSVSTAQLGPGVTQQARGFGIQPELTKHKVRGPPEDAAWEADGLVEEMTMGNFLKQRRCSKAKSQDVSETRVG